MSRQARANLAIGMSLVLLGVWLLAVQAIPRLRDWFDIPLSWPLLIVGGGVLLLLLGLVLHLPGLAIPACVIGGIGGLLYWQNTTGQWASWMYVWTLIPAFLGVGIILAGFLKGGFRSALRGGLGLVFFSLIMFVFYWMLLGSSGSGWEYWPTYLIIIGLWSLSEVLLRRR
jgi:hypothetical protein